MHTHRSYRFGTDVAPSIFVKREAGVDHSVVPCTAGDIAVGVSDEGSRSAPIPDAVPLAGKEGESAQVYSLGEPCEVFAGAAIAAGDFLKPDADGKAVPAAAGNQYSAVADASAAVGEKVKVTIERGIAV